MVVTSHAFASSRTWSPPSGMTESFDKPNGGNNETGLSIEGNRVLQAVAGATGVKAACFALTGLSSALRGVGPEGNFFL